MVRRLKFRYTTQSGESGFPISSNNVCPIDAHESNNRESRMMKDHQKHDIKVFCNNMGMRK